MITEFGSCLDTKDCATEIQQVADVSDNHLISWAYWQLKGFGDFTTVSTYVQGIYNFDGSI